tara:strand:+ start:366 stop:524 length:159 start_codon:yes stop_codon:yes gene_type:complete
MELSINKKELELLTASVESYLLYDMREDININANEQRAIIEDLYSKLIVLTK